MLHHFVRKVASGYVKRLAPPPLLSILAAGFAKGAEVTTIMAAIAAYEEIHGIKIIDDRGFYSAERLFESLQDAVVHTDPHEWLAEHNPAFKLIEKMGSSYEMFSMGNEYSEAYNWAINYYREK